MMRSYWSATYSGPHHGVFVKKLERLAGIKAVELERERFTLDDEKLEHASFFVEHHAPGWSELVLELLRVAHLICPTWTVTIGDQSLVGAAGPHLVGGSQRITGQRELRWEITQSQQYQRMTWLGGQPDRW